VQLGRLDEAEQQFEAVLQLDPTSPKAPGYLDQVKALKRNKP